MSQLSAKESKKEQETEPDTSKEDYSGPPPKGWSFRNLWISSSIKDLWVAERKFIDSFVNPDEYDVSVQDVNIPYDTTPLQVRLEEQQKELKKLEEELEAARARSSKQNRSFTGFASLFSWGGGRNQNRSSVAANSSVHPSGTRSNMLLTTKAYAEDGKQENESLSDSIEKPSQSLSSSDANTDELSENATKNAASRCCNTSNDSTQQHIHTVTLRYKSSNNAEKKVDELVDNVLHEINHNEKLDDSAVSLKSETVDIKTDEELPPVVLLHGYGCAGGIFYPCVNGFTSNFHRKMKTDQVNPNIHVLDWLGHGASSRPKFHQEYTLQDTENWFVDSLEEWRKAMNYKKLILVGHSLGGYMSAVYALRYPQHVTQLILVSPVGVPKRPEDDNTEAFLNGLDWKRRFAFKTFRKLWDSGWAPHDAVRMAGPKGKDWVSKLVKRRLFRVPDDHRLKPVLANYLYHVYAGAGSGEYALSKVLLPGAWAVNPLCDRIPTLSEYQRRTSNDVQVTTESEEKREDADDTQPVVVSSIGDETQGNDVNEGPGLRIDVVYGETDWMNPAPFVKMQEDKSCEVSIHVIEDAGHQMILEQSHRFGLLIGKLVAKSYRELVQTPNHSHVTPSGDGNDSASDSESEGPSKYIGREKFTR